MLKSDIMVGFFHQCEYCTFICELLIFNWLDGHFELQIQFNFSLGVFIYLHIYLNEFVVLLLRSFFSGISFPGVSIICVIFLYHIFLLIFFKNWEHVTNENDPLFLVILWLSLPYMIFHFLSTFLSYWAELISSCFI